MGGHIVNTRKKNHYAIMKKKDTQKNKRAKVCIGCESNKEGYCYKHNEWCSMVNYICLGIKNPYEYKPPTTKKKVRKKKKTRKLNSNKFK